MPAMTLDTPHAAPEVMISAQQIHKSFGATNVLRGISLQLQRGEVVAIIGPSGSGKSTFLRCLNHLETIDSGTITVEGDVLVQNDANGRAAYASDSQIRSIGRKMGMVFQSFNLFPHLTVLENIIEAPMLVKKMARAPMILALANPIPEILPEEVKAVRDDAIICTGRSDYPNQVNNVLCFPYIFRGALDVGATTITGEMKMASVKAIAELARAEQPDMAASVYGERISGFGPEYLIPKPFDPRLIV